MSAAAKNSIKLTYFDIAGKAEPIRLALLLSKVPFEDERVNVADWAALKPKMPYGQLPTMTIDGGEPMAQSKALLRHVGATYSETLYPRDKLFKIEEALAVMEDFDNCWIPCQYIGISPQHFGYPEGYGKTDEGKEHIKEMRINWLEHRLPYHAKNISQLIQKNGGIWMATKDQPTIADCEAFCLLHAFTRGYLDHIPTDLFDKYPTIKEYMERFEKLPEIKEWYATTK
jgi:glutathione S-transferase